jgi:hypothetical protein
MKLHFMKNENVKLGMAGFYKRQNMDAEQLRLCP